MRFSRTNMRLAAARCRSLSRGEPQNLASHIFAGEIPTEQNQSLTRAKPPKSAAHCSSRVKIGALIDAERDDTRLRCPARSHAGLRDSRHGLQNQSSAKVARNFSEAGH